MFVTTLIVIIFSLFNYGYGQSEMSNASNISNTSNSTSHCIQELEAIISPIQLNLSSSSSKIEPNYSVATSVAYHIDTSTILIAGDFFYIDPKTSKRSYYSFFKAYSHTNNKFNIKYERSAPYINPSFGNKYISHKSLRSWTRIIAHPSLPYFYVLGINNLTQYQVTNGQFMWTAKIPQCSSTKINTNNQPLIYTDATFFKSDENNIFVGGNCVGPSGKTVVVLDEYSISNNGAYDSTFRQLYNLTDLGFFKEMKYLDDFGLSPPQVTIAAPINESLQTSIVDKYFYVGFTHLLFTGIARIEHDMIADDWRVKKWPRDWTLVNPSFISHRSILTTMKQNGIISLLDPSINGLISLFIGKMKHLTRWDTHVRLGQLDEKNVYNTFTWYGGHVKYDLHMDWTLSMDNINDYKHIIVTTSPVLEIERQNGKTKYSTIAKHSIDGADIVGGAYIPFYALDSIVTNDNQIVTVGFKWIGEPTLSDTVSINTSDIMPYFERRAMFSAYDNDVANTSTCIGCETDYHGQQCTRRCICENGYCNDTIRDETIGGYCYCTLLSYGHTCRACDGIGGSCDPLKGLCNSGRDGDGTCKLCYDIDIDIGNNISNSSFGFGLGSKYGPHCDLNCTCDASNGICYTTGDVSQSNAGQCIYCTDNAFYGDNCEMRCDCDGKTQYCSNGVSGAGCVDYDYGGLLTDKGWSFYAIIASALFVIFFTVTWWQTNKQFKQQNNGQSIPWCPQKQNDDEPIINNINADLQEKMIKERNLQNDPNEPPAVSCVNNQNNENNENNENI